MISCKYHTCLS